MIKIVIDHATGMVKKVEFPPSDKNTQSQAFKAYQALADEIQKFSQKSVQIIRISRILGMLT